MSKKKNIASVLMLGATTVGLTGSTSTSAGLFDIFDWKGSKERDDSKNVQGYETAEKVAKIFLEQFDKSEEKGNENKNKKINNVIAVLENLVLEKFSEEELANYYNEKFENMQEKIKLEDIPNILDEFGSRSSVEGELIEENSKDFEKLKEKKVNFKADGKSVDKDSSKKKEKSSFFGCLGKAIWSIKDTVFGKESKFVLKLYGKDKEQEKNVAITYTKISDLTKYMGELEEKLLDKSATEGKNKILDLRIKQVGALIKKAKSKGISYEKIINTFFEKLGVEEGVLNSLKNLFSSNPFSNNHLTEMLWNKSSKNSEKQGTAKVVGLEDKDKEILHELGYERNNSRFWRGARWVGSIVLTSAVVAGLSAAFPVIAGVAAAPIGVALTGVMATIVDRVVFKTRFKEYRKMESWHPKNWEVQRFLKDTVRNTITSAMWALSIGQVLPSFF